MSNQQPQQQDKSKSVIRITDVRDAADLVDPVSDHRLIGLTTVTERESAKKTIRALQRLHAQEQAILGSIESQDPEKTEGGVVCRAPATMRNVVRPTVVSKERPLAAHGAHTGTRSNLATPMSTNGAGGMMMMSMNRTARTMSPSSSTFNGTFHGSHQRNDGDDDGFVTSERKQETAQARARHDSAVTVTTRIPASLIPFTRLAEERKRLLAIGDHDAASKLSVINAPNVEDPEDVSPVRAGRLIPPNSESRSTTTQPIFGARASTPMNNNNNNNLGGTILPPRSPSTFNNTIGSNNTNNNNNGATFRSASSATLGKSRPPIALGASKSEIIGALGSSGGNGPAVIRTIHQQRRVADRSQIGLGSEWRTFRQGSPEPSKASRAIKAAKSEGVRGQDPTMAHFLDAGRYNTAYVKPVDVLDAERRIEDERQRLRHLMETSESQVARAEHRKRLLELEQHGKSRKAQLLGTALLNSSKTGDDTPSSTSFAGRKKSFATSSQTRHPLLDIQVSDMSLVGDSFHPTYSCYGCRAPYLFMLGDDRIVEFMRKCTLVAYDITDNVYVLQWDVNDEPDEYKERMAQRDRAAMALGLPVQPRNQNPLPLKRLSPLVIRFGGESESAFAFRKTLAYQLRDREEALIRLQSYADMALKDVQSVEPLSEETIERILRHATNDLPIPERHIVLSMDLIKEIEENHDRALRSAVIEYKLKDPAMQDQLRDLRLPNKSDLIINAKLHTLVPPTFSLDNASPLVQVPERLSTFTKLRKWAEKEAFTLRPELYSGFYFSNRHWIKFEDQWLVDTEFENFALPARLIDFASRQISFTAEARRQLQHEWLGVVVTHLRGELVNTFDLYMDNQEVYRKSRAARYFRALNLMLGSRLQGLVYQTVDRFRVWVEGLNLPEDMMDAVHEVRAGLETPLHHPPFRSLVGCSLHIEVIPLSYRVEEEKERLAAEKKRQAARKKSLSERKRSHVFVEGQITRRKSQVFESFVDEEAAPHVHTKHGDEDFSSGDDDLQVDESDDEDMSGPHSPPASHKKKVKMGRSLSGLVPIVITTLVMKNDGTLGFSPSLKEVEQTFRDVFLSVFNSTDDIIGIGSSFFELLELQDRPLTWHSQRLRAQDPVIIGCSQLLDQVWKANESIPENVLELYKPLESILRRSPDEVVRKFMNAGKNISEDEILEQERLAAQVANAANNANNNKVHLMTDDFDDLDGPRGSGGANDNKNNNNNNSNNASSPAKNKDENKKVHRQPPTLSAVGVRDETDPTLADFKTICDRLFEYCRIVRGRSLGEVNTPILKVETFSAKEDMIAHIMKVIGAILDELIEWVTGDVAVAEDQYGKIFDYIQKEPTSPEELKSLREFVDKLPAKLVELETFYEDIAVRIQLLSEYGFLPPNHVFEQYWAGYSWPRKIGIVLDDMPFQMLSFRAQFMTLLTDGMKALEEELKDLQRNVNMFSFEDQEAQVERNLKRVVETEASLAKARQLAKLYNTHESIFGMVPTRFTVLIELEAQFVPHAALWKLTASMRDIEKWNDTPLEKIDGENIFATVTSWSREIARLGKIMGMEPPAAVVKTLKDKLDVFKPCIPVIMSLARPAVLGRKRHQTKLSEELKVDKFELREKSIVDLIAMGALNHIARIDELSENAEHEYRIETALSKMRDEWNTTKFVMQKTDTITLLRETDPLRLTLDEHTTKTATMLASPYAANIINEVRAWDQRLTRTSKTLDAWLICQQGFNYLYPIFFGSDIALSMPDESRIFLGISEMWSALMESAAKNSNVMSRCSDDKLLNQLTDANVKLDRIQRELVRFLDKKRQAFPRFFFLSNEDLIQILSETQDARLVQPHLRKCFEGIYKVNFLQKPNWVPPPPPQEGEGAEQHTKPPIPPVFITHMCASTGEKVELNEQVDPEAYDNQVERWLTRIEQMMIITLRDLMSKAMDDFVKTKHRNDFIPRWPGQVAMVVSSIQWTMLLENAIVNRNMREAAIVCQKWLDELVLMVRGTLSTSVLATVQAMIVLEVHNRDCADELFEKDTSQLTDFSWMCQLRYYWHEQEKYCGVKQTFASLRYGNEYLGNAPRLVITPLTDRCFRTLTSAYHMNYGGAPEGPAGTGKTETTKDLAKAIGKQCVVYNCSEQIKAAEMEKLLRGIASSGAWGCFDEFNRIELQVLSVIAQQVLTIQLAVAQKRLEFMFEGKLCALKEGSSIFVTMNPGYAGRAELPDNLKALFRPVAMMVPDYALIAENSLYSCGFLNARALASKIVATYKLSSEQLSSQSHYDYGMRAVKSVLLAAQEFRRRDPDEDESVLVLRSIADVNVPKFLTNDAMLFRWILGDLFRGVTLPEIKLASLEKGMEIEAANANFQYSEFFQSKVNQIWSTMGVRHGVMVVGGSLSGKNACLDTLAAGLTWARKNCEEHEETFLHRMNPKAMTTDHMYGSSDAAGTEWFDGVLSSHFRNAATDTSTTRRHWLVLDGPVDAMWIENMNTVLDDNKKLCLANGDVIRMTDYMTMVFVAQDLAAASPATVSRCGMIYFEPNQLGWDPLFRSWLNNVPAVLKSREEPISIFTRLVEKTIEPIRAVVAKEAPLGAPLSAQVLTYRFFEFFSVVLNEIIKDHTEETLAAASAHDLTIYLEGAFVFAVVWTFGASIRDTGRPQFDKWLRIGFTGKGKKDNPYHTAPFECPIVVSLPPENDRSLFDVAWIVPASLEGEATWVDWMSTLDLKKGAAAKKEGEAGAGADGAAAAAGGAGHAGSEGHDEGHGGGAGAGGRRRSAPKDLSDINVLEMVVPTPQTVCTMYLARQLMINSVPILLNGPTGSGKSLLLNKAAMDSLDPSQFKFMVLPLSANSTTASLQKAVSSRLERRGVGCYVPPLGTKMLLIVDDLGMPEPDQYGTQRPIELLRQLLSARGWHAIGSKTGAFHSIEKLIYAAAMQPSDSGRAMVTQRLLRRYHNIFLPPQDATSMKIIFTTIMDKLLTAPGMCPGLRNIRDNIVSYVITMYQVISDAFLPTPSHPHYTFNIRDILRTVQGLTACRGPSIKDETTFVTAITHECIRSFADRLVNDADIQVFKGIVKTNLTKVLRVNYEMVVPCEPLVYSDFLPSATEIESAGMSQVKDEQRKAMAAAGLAGSSAADQILTVLESEGERIYKPVLNFSAANNETNALVTFANGDATFIRQGRLQMIAFDYVVQHVSRVVRIIQQPRGAALLVGPGGSGRRSTARLAAFIAGHVIKQIQPTKKYNRDTWTDDFIQILRQAGERGMPSTFLLPENHIVDECILEDINCFLNVGEVPGLFTSDIQDQIFGAMGPAAREAQIEPTQDGCLNLFWKRCRTNLHMIVTLSPVGAAFRSNIRKFPALVNCTTIDWFLEWPLDGLLAVGSSIVAKNEHWTEKEAKFIVETGVNMYSDACAAFAKAKDLKLPVKLSLTPSVFLDLLDTFERFKKQKSKSYTDARDRYVNGVAVLIRTQKMVAELQLQLEAAAPALEAAARKTEDLVKTVDADAAEVEKERKIIAQDEAVAAEIANKAKAVKEDCEAGLATAMPAMNAALNAVSSIDKKQLIELRSLTTPPEKARPVFEAICIVLEVKPREIKDANSNKKEYDYWTPMKTKVMADIEAFKQQLLTYDKENMKPDIFENKLKPYIADRNFRPDVVKDVSQALVGLVEFVIAMERYYRVFKVVKPKMILLKQAEDAYAAAAASLAEKNAKLKAITDRLDRLKQNLADALAEKRRLENEQKQTQAKLNRATRLLSGLSSEKDRYREAAEEFGKKLLAVAGDALLSSAIVVLLGALPQSVRVDLRQSWIEKVAKSLLPCTSPFELEAVLGDPATTLGWRICGLPSDAFSVDNAIIYYNTGRVPMLVDPHDQGGAWIKTMERNKEGGTGNFACVRASDPGLPQALGSAVQQGSHILIEGCSESLDSIVLPIVNRQYGTYDGKKIVSVGEATLTVHPDFRLTLSTRIATPTFMTDTSSAVCLVGFFVTKDGLQEQLLQKVLQHEEREQDQKRSQYIEQGAKSKAQLRQIEDNILTMVSTRTDLLESDDVITQLESGKKTAQQVEQRLTEIEGFQRSFEKIRLRYVPFATGAAQVYTDVTSLAFVDPVYQFSLMWFLRLFMQSMATPEHNDDEDKDAVKNLPSQGRVDAFSVGGADSATASAPKLHHLLKSDHVASFPPHITMRVNECFDKLLNLMHRDVTRATFSKDHVVGEMLITTGLKMETDAEIQQFHYFVRGRPATAKEIVASRHPTERPTFLTAEVWTQVCQVSEDLEGNFADFSTKVSQNEHKQYSEFVETCFQMTSGELPPGSPFPSLPNYYAVRLTDFEKLIFVAIMYPPLVVAAAKEYLTAVRGSQVLVPAPIDINAIISENPDPTTVILFVLSSGVDPQQSWRAAAADHGMEDRVDTLSLGHGMGKRAKELIDDGKTLGRWVLLQNCHLYKDWMPDLDRVVQDLALLAADPGAAVSSSGAPVAKPRGLNAKFRLWLTAAPTDAIPPSIWFRCLKTALEPPQGLRSGIQRALLSPNLSDPAFFNGPSEKPALWRRVCFALCAFDAVLHERKRFGPVGWNIPYGFSEADLATAMNQVQRLIIAYNEVPLEAASYLIGECFYGGRVTDVHDRFVLQAILANFLRAATEEVGPGSAGIPLPLEADPIAAPSEHDKSPGWKALWKHAQAVSSDDPNPEACGLHISANLTRLYRDASMLKDSISDALPPAVIATSGHGDDESDEEKKKKEAAKAKKAQQQQQQQKDDQQSVQQQREVTPVEALCVDILKALHPVFDVDAVQQQRPMTYEDVMNTVLLLELGRYNRLLDKMHKSLKGLVRALRGESVMSAELDSIREDIERGRLPAAWKGSCYPSLRGFASFMADLTERLTMLDTWINDGPPIVVWLGGLYFPQPFVTGTMQNFSREVGVAIDRIEWEFTVVHGNPTAAAAQGCFVGGMYLEAGGWSFDSSKCGLTDPSATELKVPFPVLKLTPVVPPVKAQNNKKGGSKKSKKNLGSSGMEDEFGHQHSNGQHGSRTDMASRDNLSESNSGGDDDDDDNNNHNNGEDDDDENVQTSVPFVAYEDAETAHFPGPWKRVARHVAHPALFYHCPLYRTYERRGVLSTTGHSTNFIFRVALPIAPSMSEKVIGAEYFIRRGTALFTSSE